MNLKRMTKTAVIAALYCALTLCFAPISYGVVQLRISEVLTVLPKFSKSSVWGLAIGCLLSNYIGMVAMGTTVYLNFADMTAAD